MKESMDIIEYLESNKAFGPTSALRPSSGRTDLKEWQQSVRSLTRTLQRPRYVATGLIAEFQQRESRTAYITNHPLPPFDRSEWKAMDATERSSAYATALEENDPIFLVEQLNARLVALDDIVVSDRYCTEGGLSLDDVDLWSRLRSITIVANVEWPEKLRRYMDNLSALTDVALYDQLAM